MHGLPPDFDAGVFVGAELDVVSFSANTVHFAFGTELSLTISGPFSYVVSTGSARVTQEVPAASSAVMSLVGGAVVLASASPDGTLALQFSEGGRIECVDSSTQYESYTIRIRDREIFV